MELKAIHESPPNKTATKALLNDEECNYLEITEDVDDIQLLDHLIITFLAAKEVKVFSPIKYNYYDKCYTAFVANSYVIKWNNKIYNAGDIIGTIKDREMI